MANPESTERSPEQSQTSDAALIAELQARNAELERQLRQCECNLQPGIPGKSVDKNTTKYTPIEQSLQESEERFRQIAETIQQFFFIREASGQYLYISPAYETIWGRSCASL